ncbi:serine hydrolase domain-containing protein [Carboxylicivirga sp. N1Y90]|uniref:serine hydrolase domain-containing protein n=1 Tax=Carboxylicivirga fragile TaxID=3417571 RepID=UPI003D334585|nr:beta-lactamase family protein [Marinilabiliaceae bacterium N1Y90]
MNKLLFLSIVLVCIASCSSPRKKHDDSSKPSLNLGCIHPKDSVSRKGRLENGIRSQVKFVGESEAFSSITDKMSTYKIPALSLALIKQGKIEWADIYQNENFPEEQKLDCTSLFQAASLSKPVTFLAAVRMHSAGEIELDKNIQSYLKHFVLPQGKQTEANPVTFRNIFSHTSGISPGGYEGYARDLPIPSDLDILRGSPGVNSPAIEVITAPNETLAYAGGAYTLAELALQDIYGDSFENIMNRWILDPLRMTNSDFSQPLPTSKIERVAKAYTQSGEVLNGGWRNYPEQAAAGLWSNSIDMAKFLIEIYKAYQGKSTLFSQSEIQSLISHERDGLAYGFIVGRQDSSLTITHYGGNTGYRTGMTIDLTTGNGLVYLTNSDNGGSLGNELFLSASQVYGWQHFKQTDVHRNEVSSEVLKGLSGEYKWNKQIDLSIKYDENNAQISLFFPNGDAYELTPIRGDELNFIHPSTGIRVTFLSTDDFKSFSLYGQTAVKL